MNTYTEAMAEQTFLSSVMLRLNRRKTLIVGQTIVVFLLAAVGIQLLPKSFLAAASVVIEASTPTAVPSMSNVTTDAPWDDQTIGTEVAILQSRELLTDAINRTGLLNKPEFNPNIRPTTLQGKLLQNLRVSLAAWLPEVSTDVAVAPSEQAMADTLMTLRKHVKLVPLPHSRVIEIDVTANNNRLAASIANTIADLYIANHRDYKQSTSRDAHEFLDGRIVELRNDAASKAAAVEQYRIAHGLTTAMTSTLIQEQVSGLSAQLQTARATLAEVQGRANTAAHSNPQQLAAVLASPTIQKLREQESTYAAERAKLAAIWGPNHPMLGRIDAQLAGVQGQIAAEARRAVQSLPNDVASAQANVDSLSKRMADLKAQASQMDEARAHLNTLEDDANSARSVYAAFLSRLRETDAAMAYGAVNVRVISHAAVPIRAAFPDQVIMLPASLVLSLLLAGITAYLTTSPKGIVGSDDIENMFGDITALGMIPIRNARSAAHFDTAIEQLLNRLIIMDNQPRSILITSALPEEGKTTTSRALADAALRRGLNVLLVDADMRSAQFSRPRSAAVTMGLGDVLRGDADVRDVVSRGGSADGLPMLPAGSPRGNPTRLMALPALGSMMSNLTAQYDLVIVDAPPALVGGDCEMLTRHVDTTVMLAKWHSTAPEAVAVALKQLGKTHIAGMVLTMVDPDKIVRFGQSDAVIYSEKLYRYYQAK